jgi:hypothetical protein
MKTAVVNPVKACALIAFGLAVAAMGIYVAEADDAPGPAVMGMLLMVAGVVLGLKAARNRLPVWAARTALGVGVAAFAAFLTHGVTVTAPLFAQSQQVPSVIGPAPAPQHAAAVERARELVRAAVMAQNQPRGVRGGRYRLALRSLGEGGHHRLGRRVRMERRLGASARHAGHAIQHRHGGIRGRRLRGAARAHQYRR